MISSFLPILTELGLDESEARAYLALLELGTASISEISLRSGLKRTSIYNFINRLVELGIMVQRVEGSRKKFKATSPETLIALQEKRLGYLKERVHDLASVISSTAEKPRISYYASLDQIKQILYEIPRCKNEVLMIWPDTVLSNLLDRDEFMNDLFKQRLEAGVSVKAVILSDDTKFSVYKDKKLKKTAGRQIRMAPPSMEMPMAVCIFDTGKVAFISSAKEGFGFLIQSNDVYTSMRSLFALAWAESTHFEE